METIAVENIIWYAVANIYLSILVDDDRISIADRVD